MPLPVTGRMHQIRIHPITTQRASIVGDEMYKVPACFPFEDLNAKMHHLGKDQEEQPIMKRFALHAYEVTFKLLNGESITIQRNLYPKRFLEVLLHSNGWKSLMLEGVRRSGKSGSPKRKKFSLFERVVSVITQVKWISNHRIVS